MPNVLCAWKAPIMLFSSSVLLMIMAAGLTCVELVTATQIALISLRRLTPRVHCSRKFLQIVLAVIWIQYHWLQVKKPSRLTFRVHCVAAR
jgi:hypothetical protein